MLKRTGRRTLLVLLFALLAVSCGSSGHPTDYDATVEENFVEGCRVAREDLNADNAEAVCKCAYDEIAATISFEDFEDLDDRVRGDLTVLNTAAPTSAENQVVDIVTACILGN